MIDYITQKKIEILFLNTLLSILPDKQTDKNHSNVSNNHDAPGVRSGDR